MKNQLGKVMCACLTLSIGLSLLALGTQECAAQTDKQGKKEKPISAADQRAITEIFKGVDQSKYRLQFNQGKRVLGKKAVEMRDLEQVKKFRNPGEAAGWIILIVEGKDVIYILAVGSSDLQNVLGKEKTAKLNQIMAKYAR